MVGIDAVLKKGGGCTRKEGSEGSLIECLWHIRTCMRPCICDHGGFIIKFNKISATCVLWQSVLLVEESGIVYRNHWPASNHRQTLSHNVVSSTPHHVLEWNSLLKWGFISIDCIGEVCKSLIIQYGQWPQLTPKVYILCWRIQINKYIHVLNSILVHYFISML